MQRIVGLVTRLTEASRSALTLRALANVAAGALVELFPKSSVVVFKRDQNEPLAHIIGGANLPLAWKKQVVRLADVPLLDEALRNPERVSVRSAYRGRRNDAGMTEITDGLQTFCAAVPDSNEPLYALMFLVPADPGETEACEAAIEITRQLLARSSVNRGSQRGRILAAIHRAKLEWEHTADALPEIVGLLDSKWQVVRVSRALERWRLGTVKSAVGLGLHSLLHSACTDSGCLLGAFIERAILELSHTPYAHFEIADPVLSLDLDVAISAARTQDGKVQKSQRIVFTVGNVTSLRNVERELKSLNHSLELRIEERTREILATNHSLRREIERRRSAEKLLRRSKRDLEALSERLMNAQEAERKRISQDMHDSVGQMLSAIKYSLERAELLSRQDAHDEASPVIAVAIRRVQNLMEEVRAISMNLRPASLDDLGAASAVRGLCRDWQDVYRGIDMETEIEVLDIDIPPILATNVFRAVQESLNNVARHAEAHHVRVSMRIEAGILKVAVCDDGAGFQIGEDGPANGTRGLRGLRERAERTGGRLELSSAFGKGTTVQLEWPVGAGQAAFLANASLN